MDLFGHKWRKLLETMWTGTDVKAILEKYLMNSMGVEIPRSLGEDQLSIEIKTRQSGDITILDVSGKITLGEGSSALRDKVRDLSAAGSKKLLLNLGDVTYIDSSGIGELVSAFTTTSNQGGSLKLLNLTKRVKDLLQITKLYTVFEVWEDEPHAVASFK
jgi:anti-sigma B factor antagonist